MKKKLLIIGLVLFVLGGAGAVIGYVFVYNKQHRNIEKANPDFEITADALYQAFADDEIAAGAMYTGKVVQISGTIESINTVNEAMKTIVMPATGAMLGGVNALLHEKYATDAKYKDALSGLQEGNSVTLKCKCTGFNLEVELNNCFIASTQ